MIDKHPVSINKLLQSLFILPRQSIKTLFDKEIEKMRTTDEQKMN